MAEYRVQDVVDQTLSAGDLSPSDAPETTSTTTDHKPFGETKQIPEVEIRENGIHTPLNVKMDDFEDASGRSDTDTSRAEGSVAGDKTMDQKPLKKPTPKPISFAKYSVPKVIAAANAAAKPAEKSMTLTSSNPSQQSLGRPRLVAKTTSSLQTTVKPYKSAAPDPMQVWNKNRVTPTPSTKHLTDEELKQQYGIHLTSRLQTDADGKEAKWADIDDDEDDWAPETIEWNDGTKTTLTAGDITPNSAQKAAAEQATIEKAAQNKSTKPLPSTFTPTLGPNTTVLRLGANAERQQAQKATEKLSKSPLEKSTSTSTTPAPAPSKSPWATLPPVDKVSPVTINPQPVPNLPRFPSTGYPQPPAGLNAASPAKEISADDFNRSWRESVSSQPRELYMPNSGRYEAVPEGRRRMSKNDQNFRAPAVLQRPSQNEMHAPAEPSAAFQTNRTSTDSARRRASSIISGGSGQFARRMSIKTGDVPPPPSDSEAVDTSVRPGSSNGPPSQGQTPTYQVRAGSIDYMSAAGQVPSSYDLEAQRVQQKALMKESIDRARQRKIEEEARLEAEKQERIRQKLASLGPDPKVEKVKVEQSETTAAPAPAEKRPSQDSGPPVIPLPNTTNHSPPKPPQPLATGEPQQYGMMKVHALDTVKRTSIPSLPQPDQSRTSSANKMEASPDKTVDGEETKLASSTTNGARLSPEAQRHVLSDISAQPDRSPRIPKPSSSTTDARSSWADIRDHRPPGNLWGLPNNKALGNGTFDQSLAGYAPQDLSRTPTAPQSWMNNRTPTAARSPQTQHAHQHVPENRSHMHQPLISPDQPPLAADSEVDSLFPTTRPAPIGPPQTHPTQPPQNMQPAINGYQNTQHMNGNLAAWHNFQHTASQAEKSENERFQRELAARREEEMRTGVRQGPQYTFNETWKQVNLGDQAGQRQVTNVNQTSTPASPPFGMGGKFPPSDPGIRLPNGQSGRGSRFFPQHLNGPLPQERRSFTYSHPEEPRTPSPPPAEEYASLHPAYSGDVHRPAVRLPPEKARVKLPPAVAPTPPEPVQPAVAPPPEQPMTWAARVSMPAAPPAPAPALRSVSTPIVQNPSWQERFNGLLGKKTSPVRQNVQLAAPALAVTSSTREPLDVILPAVSAAVSLPQHTEVVSDEDDGLVTSKDVEDEEDLFEDRELASLPAISFPSIMQALQFPLAEAPRKLSYPVESSTAHLFMVSNAFERHFQKPQFAIIRLPEQTKFVKRDIPLKGVTGQNENLRSRNVSGGQPSKPGRFTRGPKPRQTSKAH